MKMISTRMGLVVGFAILLASCSTPLKLAALDPLPVGGKNDSRWALVIRESPDGKITHEWLLLDDLGPSLNEPHEFDRNDGHFVLTSAHPRDCHAEYMECINECMSRPLPRGFGHITRRGGLGGKEGYCNQRCMRPYRDCLDLQDLKPQEFSTSDAAVEWLKAHDKEIMVGSVFIIAGTAFVVVSGGAGLFVLTPVLLMSGTAQTRDSRFVVAAP